MQQTALDRFWAKVDIGDLDSCWEYTGAKDSSGYGSFWFEKKAVVASRFSLILKTGENRDGEVGRHSCNNPPCCNPKHLAWGTHEQNMQDMILAGRAQWQKEKVI